MTRQINFSARLSVPLLAMSVYYECGFISVLLFAFQILQMDSNFIQDQKADSSLTDHQEELQE